MRSILAAIAISFLSGAAQAEVTARVFDPVLSADAPKCVTVDAIAKLGKVFDLSQEQFQFVRAIYAMIPPISHELPPGDKAIVAGGSDGTAMVAIIDGQQSCARFAAPNFMLQMLNDIATHKTTHVGDPT